MTEPFWMVRLRLDPRQLARRGSGLPTRHEDTGYEAHALLAGLFGEGTVQPFRVQPPSRHDENGMVVVLGYTGASPDALRRHAQEFADPADHAACDWDALAAKEMPTRCERGRTLGFELRACPVVRLSSEQTVTSPRGEIERYRAGTEVDAWIHRNFISERNGDSNDARVSRDEVYRDWLRDRLEPGAELVSARLHAFRRCRLLRFTHGTPRRARLSERPDALFRGELRVGDPDALHNLLRRGVARHRAYGFGMLLLRPTS